MKVLKDKALLLILVVSFLVTGTGLFAEGPWKVIDSSSGITVSERWIQVNNDLKVRERKGEMTVNGSMNNVLEVLCDPSTTSLWMENVTQAYMVNRISDTEWSSYIYFSMPWPFDNRDMVSVSRLHYYSPGLATIVMTSQEDELPFYENVKRLLKYKATWKITDIGDGQINISFSTVSYTSPEFPRLIMDPVVRGVFMRNLIKFKLLICI